MQKYGVNELRRMFLEFFESKGHLAMKSFSLVPHNDKSLLLINSGMAPLKPYFTGQEIPPRRRVTTCQKCIRTGDIENVGKTARHGTFFEMLGNFSFGDYFKDEAIHWTWEFLTEVVGLDPDRLYPSIYQDDDEAFEIWNKEIGIPAERIFRFGKEDNFWEHGAGPCGPCSEVYYDRGEKYGCGEPGCTVGCECDRYMEIWNNVFTQFDNDGHNNYTELEQKNIDTGMGLERLACIVQDVDSMFDIDTLKALRDHVCRMAGVEYKKDDNTDTSIRVLTDHIRSVTFMISDGILPSNSGRGYVLRRLLRRACRHGRLLGIKGAFLVELAQTVIDGSKDGYPELEEKGLTYDEKGFEEAQKEQRAKSEGTFGTHTYSGKDASVYDQLDAELSSEFVGYDQLEVESEVTAITSETEVVDALTDGDKGTIIVAKTPFYATMGGQEADKGIICTEDGEFVVEDVVKLAGGKFGHVGQVTKGMIKVGDKVTLKVDKENRVLAENNHSATHLLQKALRMVLGNHVEQAGSLNNAQRLRFDFTHFSAMTAEELQKVEDIVNEKIRENLPVVIKNMPIEEAKKTGAAALFGEKYGDIVRVVSMGDFSIEFCGGTHVSNTGNIMAFKILSETGVAAGVRRIEALTSKGLLEYYSAQEKKLHETAKLLKATPENIEEKVSHLMNENKALKSEVESLKSKLAKDAMGDVMNQVEEVKGVKFLAANLEGVDMNGLRDLGDQLKEKLGEGVILLASVNDGKVSLMATATDGAMKQGAHAGNLIKAVAKLVGGGGGGRPNMAQAGGKNPAGVADALKAAKEALEGQLA